LVVLEEDILFPLALRVMMTIVVFQQFLLFSVVFKEVELK